MAQRKKTGAEHIAKGNYRPSRHLTADLEDMILLKKAPPVPESLQAIPLAVYMWNEIVPQLVKNRLLAPEDLPLLTEVLKQCRVIEVLDISIQAAIEAGDVAAVLKIGEGRNKLLRSLSDMLLNFGCTGIGRQRLLPTIKALMEKDNMGDIFKDLEEE